MQLYLFELLFMYLIHTNSVTSSALLQRNNVCESIEDYYTIQDNKNCRYDYVTALEMPELLEKSGRSFEIYKVVTSDGHILTLFRISNSKLPNRKRSPVFLQHGVVCSAKNWVSLGNDSLAFQLHNHGFDVWLGNYRGTKYSDEHISLSVKDEEYWEHTIDDITLIDLAAMFNKVVEVTGEKGNIIYVGHSLGGTLGLMYASDLPAQAKTRMKAMLLVAPAYHLSHAITPFRVIAKFADQIWDLVKRQQLLPLVSYGPIINGLIRSVCLKSPKSMVGCTYILEYIYGPKTGIKPNQLPNFLKQQFTGTSLKILHHLTTFFKDMFNKFDYGLNNTSIYGQKTVPIYDVSKIDIPTIIVTARNDWLTSNADALQLAKDMNKKYVHKVVEIDDDYFNHMDYMFGSRSREVFVDVVLRDIENIDRS